MLWQRAAGGFSAGQQRELAQRVMGELGLSGKKAVRFNPQIERESWRLLASLERLEARDARQARRRAHAANPSRRRQCQPSVGDRPPRRAGAALRTAQQHRAAARRGSMDRRAARHQDETPELAAAVVQIGALTGDPLRDLDRQVVDAARQRLRDADVDRGVARPLHEVVTATFADANRVFGEPLPHGLRLDVPAECRKSLSLATNRHSWG